MMKNSISQLELDQLRKLPIENVAERLGLSVYLHKSRCPFHDDHTPSLYYNIRNHTYRCFACGEHGNVIGLARKLMPQKSFREVCQWLAQEYGIALQSLEATATKHVPSATQHEAVPFDAQFQSRFFEHPQLSAKARDFLFQERLLNPAVVRYCRLNSLADWLQIPYYSSDGQLVGTQRRYMADDGNRPRFLFYKGSECRLYNLPVLRTLQPREDLYIAEGPSDCWAMLSAGHKAIAISSATMLDRNQLQKELLAARIPQNRNMLHVYPDRDEAGEKLFRRLFSVTKEAGIPLVRHELPKGCKDFSDYWIRQNTKDSPALPQPPAC